MPKSDYSLSIADGEVTLPRSALAFSPVFGEGVAPTTPGLSCSRNLEDSRNHSSRSGRQAVRQRLRATERREQPSTKALLVSSVTVLSSRRSLCYGGVRFDCRKLTPSSDSRMAVNAYVSPGRTVSCIEVGW